MAGSGGWAKVTQRDISDLVETLQCRIDDISGANAAFIACPVAGVITRIDTVVTGDTGGETVLTANINGGTNITQTVTIRNGSAAGERDSALPADNRSVAVGDAIKILSNGGAGNAVSAYISVTVEVG